ncbi:MAG: hypothetical protein MI867_18230, partial [Pseudomonadales bacterium]|nr:hypothetical protein [Pseudomonadales bacterium]
MDVLKAQWVRFAIKQTSKILSWSSPGISPMDISLKQLPANSIDKKICFILASTRELFGGYRLNISHSNPSKEIIIDI